MGLKAMSPLLAAILLVACDSVATGAPATLAADAVTATPPNERGEQRDSESSAGGSAVAGTNTEASGRSLRDSYYECAASNDGSTWDMQACVKEEFEYQDARLNTAYRKVMASLADPEKNRLRNEERRWMSDRDSACSWDARLEGQAQRIEANICALKKTADRAAELEKKLD